MIPIFPRDLEMAVTRWGHLIAEDAIELEDFLRALVRHQPLATLVYFN